MFQVIVFERMAQKLPQNEYNIKNMLKFMFLMQKNNISLSKLLSLKELIELLLSTFIICWCLK